MSTSIGSRGGGGGGGGGVRGHRKCTKLLMIFLLYTSRPLTSPKVYTFFYRPPTKFTLVRKSYFRDNSANKHPHLTNLVSLHMLSGSRSIIMLLPL